MRLCKSEHVALETAKFYAHNWSKVDMEMHGFAPYTPESSSPIRNVTATDARHEWGPDLRRAWNAQEAAYMRSLRYAFSHQTTFYSGIPNARELRRRAAQSVPTER
jgi:hypothetical protein